jgi:predicted dinucleotide-binding enzyme
MTIGIIGSGAIGTAFAHTLAHSGIEATISNSRGPDSLKDLVRELGPVINAGTRQEAARADIVLVAVNWTKLPAALAGLPEWGGRIVIDANNPIEAPLFKPVDLKGRVSSELVVGLVPGARVVKAFNHLRAEVLAADPRSSGGRRVLFYSGNDSAAKAEVAALIDSIGFAGIDLGSLAIEVGFENLDNISLHRSLLTMPCSYCVFLSLLLQGCDSSHRRIVVPPK